MCTHSEKLVSNTRCVVLLDGFSIRKTPAVKHNVNNSLYTYLQFYFLPTGRIMMKISGDISSTNQYLLNLFKPPLEQSRFFKTCRRGSVFITICLLVCWQHLMNLELIRFCLLYYATFKCYRKFYIRDFKVSC